MIQINGMVSMFLDLKTKAVKMSTSLRLICRCSALFITDDILRDTYLWILDHHILRIAALNVLEKRF